MDPLSTDAAPWRALLLAAVPLAYLLAAAVPGWRGARLAAAAALAAAVAALAVLAFAGAALWRGPVLVSLGNAGALQPSLRHDLPGGLMLLLVSFIGWVIVGYSRTYLDGERGQQRYIRGLLLTLAAVTLLVSTNNLLLLALAWIGTSLALHGPLTFYGDRLPAQVAAHKKFIASRVAEACLLGAIALVGATLGTLEIDRAIAAARALPELPFGLQAAALLFASAALIKCAQLPLHGWLIQVMEAPTPVSALLHAGVVNLGGFVLIRLGGLVADVPAAQALLVVVGSVTAVVAALVMMTRISIKVELAWSTCAQMGFMMMQCGLGLYELAMLHLVAHSLYKAYAFLNAGGAVEQNRLQQMTKPAPQLGVAGWLAGAVVGLGVVAAAALAWGLQPAAEPALWAVGVILALALAPLVAGSALRAGGLWALAGVGAAFAVAFVYFGLHALFSAGFGPARPGAAPGLVLVVWVIGAFALMFLVQGLVRARPQGALARGLYPWLFSGLYLDELFTRLTFRVWPARLTPRPAAPAAAAATAATAATAAAAAAAAAHPEARHPGAL